MRFRKSDIIVTWLQRRHFLSPSRAAALTDHLTLSPRAAAQTENRRKGKIMLSGLKRQGQAALLLQVTAFLWSILIPASLFSQANSSPPNLSDQRLIATGRTIFAQSCSVGYCHGKEGKAGRGPRLRGKTWDKGYLFKVTHDGIPNSSMPAWNDKLSNQEIWAVVAYIQTLSSLTSDAEEAPVTDVASADLLPEPEVKPKSSPQRIPGSGDKSGAVLYGSPSNGKELFFDVSNDRNCGVCHKVDGVGGDLGPDLSKVKAESAKHLLEEIVLPNAGVSEEFRRLKLVTKSGEEIVGVKAEETASEIRIHDVTALPPVLRTISKSDIASQQHEARSIMPDDYAKRHTLQQLVDIIAFLKSENASSGSMAVEDLF